jgi:O-antigen/teichoic acid export membrane protein
MRSALVANLVSNVIQALVNILSIFLLYRFVSQVLGMEALGIWSVVFAAASVSRLTDLGLTVSVTRLVALEFTSESSEGAAKVVETALLTLIIVTPIFLFALYPVIRFTLRYFFISETLLIAIKILPLALVSLYLSILSAAIQSGLDGCEKMAIRATLVTMSQIFLLVSSFYLIPEFGLVGLGWAQIIQGVFLVAASWYCLRMQLVRMNSFPRNWSRPIFFKMLGYGSRIQLSNLIMMLFDPLTKVLLAKYGGLTAAGYFEVASQIVAKVRAPIIAANQAIIPKVSNLVENSRFKIKRLYQRNIEALAFFSLPAFAVIVLMGKFLSILLIGSVKPEFIVFLRLIALAWCVNVFSGSAYFINIGSGSVGLNAKVHVLMGVLNAFLGWVLGQAFGATGVVLGYSLSLAIGSLILIIVFQRENNISFKYLKLNSFVPILILCAAIYLYSFFKIPEKYNNYGSVDLENIFRIFLLSLLLAIIAAHPFAASLWKSIYRRHG